MAIGAVLGSGNDVGNGVYDGNNNGAHKWFDEKDFFSRNQRKERIKKGKGSWEQLPETKYHSIVM